MPSSSVSKSTKYFFSSAVSWDFFAIGDSFRDDCQKGDAHGSAGSRIAEAKKAHKERGQAQEFLSVKTDQKICASSCFCALGSKQSDLFVVESIEFI